MSDSSVAKAWLHNSLPIPEWIPTLFEEVERIEDNQRCLVVSIPVRDEMYDMDFDLEEQPWSCDVLIGEEKLNVSLAKLSPRGGRRDA